MPSLSDIKKEEQLAFVELCLLTFGGVKRQWLMQRFSISGSIATRIINEYRKQFPDNIDYSLSERQYVITGTSKSFFTHNVNDAFQLSTEGCATIQSVVEPVSIHNQLPVRSPDINTISPVMQGIARKRAVEINYVSRSSGKKTRAIYPLTLIQAGNAYYVRAYDLLKDDYRSFKLNRIINSKLTLNLHPIEITLANDTDWQQMIDVTISLRDDLLYPKAIAIDYGLVKKQRTIRLRKALYHYLLMDWNIAPQGSKNLSSELFPVIVTDISPAEELAK